MYFNEHLLSMQNPALGTVETLKKIKEHELQVADILAEESHTHISIHRAP